MSRSRNLLLGSALTFSVLAGPAVAEKLGLGRAAVPFTVTAEKFQRCGAQDGKALGDLDLQPLEQGIQHPAVADPVAGAGVGALEVLVVLQLDDMVDVGRDDIAVRLAAGIGDFGDQGFELALGAEAVAA